MAIYQLMISSKNLGTGFVLKAENIYEAYRNNIDQCIAEFALICEIQNENFTDDELNIRIWSKDE